MRRARPRSIRRSAGTSPVWAHIPLIHGPDGAKLSKRHGALGVDAYRAMGYLPAALRNYLVRLGWSQGDKEFFSTDEIIAAFDLPAIGRSASRFDFAKLENMNGHFMRASSDDDLFEALIDALPYLPGGPEVEGQARRSEASAASRGDPGPQRARQDAGRASRRRGLPVRRRGRCRWTRRPPTSSPKEAARIWRRCCRSSSSVTEWSGPALEAVVRTYAEETGAKLGAVAQPLRAALTGRSTSPGIFDVLTVLGRDESLGRIADQAKP